MKKKQLAILLDELGKFDNPKIYLEQYTTPTNIVISFLEHIHNVYGDIENKNVADFGCGIGKLGFGTLSLGASFVTLFEIENDAIEQCLENAEFIQDQYGFTNFNIIQVDITNLKISNNFKFDTIIMNPPFGTKNKGFLIKY